MTNLSATVKEAVADAECERSQKKPPKRVLAVPDLEHAKTAVPNTRTSAVIVEYMIAMPAKIKVAYEKLPAGAREAIKKRDKK